MFDVLKVNVAGEKHLKIKDNKLYFINCASAQDNGDIEYEKQFEYVKVTIYFVNKEKVIEMSSDAEITYTIEFDELQAINKQVEELGWK